MTTSTYRDRTVAELRGYAAELADSHETVTPAYAKTRGGRLKLVGVHRVEHAGLLAQLAEVAMLGLTTSDDVPGARQVPQSRPPGQWEALSRHTVITLAACRWTWDFDLPQRHTVEGNVRQLAGAAGEPRIVDDVALAELRADMRSWRAWSLAATGQADAPYRPHATCPILTCGQLGTLRVNLGRRVAYCTACESTWDDVDGSITVLADYIAQQGEVRAIGEQVRSGYAGRGGAWSAEHVDQPTR